MTMMMMISLNSGSELTMFKKDGQSHDYNFANNEPFGFTLAIRENGNLHLRALQGNPAATLSCKCLLMADNFFVMFMMESYALYLKFSIKFCIN